MNEPLAAREAPAGYVLESQLTEEVATLAARVEGHLKKMGFQP
ncbi:MAG: hypothetical protein Q7U78_14825 [Gallionella sp.]|nr:hypothetical protein [Gallionella sp.]